MRLLGEDELGLEIFCNHPAMDFRWNEALKESCFLNMLMKAIRHIWMILDVDVHPLFQIVFIFHESAGWLALSTCRKQQRNLPWAHWRSWSSSTVLGWLVGGHFSSLAFGMVSLENHHHQHNQHQSRRHHHGGFRVLAYDKKLLVIQPQFRQRHRYLYRKRSKKWVNKSNTQHSNPMEATGTHRSIPTVDLCYCRSNVDKL